jgi:hypothetical protein
MSDPGDGALPTGALHEMVVALVSSGELDEMRSPKVRRLVEALRPFGDELDRRRDIPCTEDHRANGYECAKCGMGLDLAALMAEAAANDTTGGFDAI